ncbi:MAG TPA: malonyl-CoA decarboxylase [Stellaceae bacterium]|nr:malonyl-CoA decarboxylase [Stellaceae bacterium]
MSERSSVGFFDTVVDRTIGRLRAAWRDIAGQTRGANASTRPELTSDDMERVREQLRACLDGRGGEVAARVRAAELGRTYLGLNADGRKRFLRLLADEFDVDREAISQAAKGFLDASAHREREASEEALRTALEAPRRRLLTQFNALPEGVKFLVDMRAELMALARGDRALAGLERDLRALLRSWFDIGFLELKRITWNSPASLLEKLTAYEAVHEIRSWADLKHRLEADRRCFAFFHPRMPEEPLIFVEVALVKGISGSIQALLDESAPVADPRDADTAVFYSISNCQRGLAGISFGDFLIKRVADDLAAELPHLKTFATLSPVPGFRAWLDARLAKEEAELLLPAEREAIAALPGDKGAGGLAGLLAEAGWHEDRECGDVMQAPLMRLCARFLLTEKGSQGRALDLVEHFHLTNGARVERLNWLADHSLKGLQQSAGIMVNYLYRLAEVEANHEAYTGEARVAAAGAVKSLARLRDVSRTR